MYGKKEISISGCCSAGACCVKEISVGALGKIEVLLGWWGVVDSFVSSMAEPEVAAGGSVVVSSSRSVLFGEKIRSAEACKFAFSLLLSCSMRISDRCFIHLSRSHVFGFVWLVMGGS